MKKTFFGMIFLVMVMTGTAFGADNDIFDMNASLEVYSRYVGGTGGMELYNNPVIQGSLMIKHVSGFYLKPWGSYSLQDKSASDAGKEIDYIAGINRGIGPVNVDLSYAYYNLYELSKHSTGDIEAYCLSVSFPEIFKQNSYFPGMFQLSPYLVAEYDYAINDSDSSGLFYKIGASYCLDDLSLDFSAGGHTEAFGSRDERVSYLRATVSYEMKLTENLILVPVINFQKRVGYSVKNGGMTKDLIWGGLSFSYSF